MSSPNHPDNQDESDSSAASDINTVPTDSSFSQAADLYPPVDGSWWDRSDDGEDDESSEGADGEAETHRGAFGDFGGEIRGGFLDRAFRERIVIVGMAHSGRDPVVAEASLDELELLVDTAGADVAARIMQRRDKPDRATFVGKGKVQEILAAALEFDADTVVFDDELTPAQGFNLEKILKRTALDRTAVILDIFAQHATSAEGKTQVELAQLRYNLPRLRGKKSFSQQGGGIGTRGPGETQLEVDRRRLVRRIHKLERDLRDITARRENQRKARGRSPYSVVSIVGYTNAGKSTLLKALTGADVKIEDQLFATVDPTTRKHRLRGGEQILLTDTVGFVKKLPHTLVEAFKSTLEVAAAADLLIHVVDGAGPDPDGHILAVREVLNSIDAGEVEQLLVFNKLDASEEVKRLVDLNPGSVGISAQNGLGIDELLMAIGDRLRANSEVYEVAIPFARGDIIASVHREGEVLAEYTEELGMRYTTRLSPDSASRLDEWIIRD